MAVVDRPVVEWGAVVRAAQPTDMPTRARLRTLRSKGVLSDGVLVQGGRSRGSHTYYLTAFAYAARFERDGDHHGAVGLAASATRMESRWRSRLTEFLLAHSLNELSQASWYGDLLRESGALLSEHNADRVALVRGVVEGLDPMVHITGVAPDGSRRDVDLPSNAIEGMDIGVGDPIVVLQRRPSSGTVVLEVFGGVTAPDVGSLHADATPGGVQVVPQEELFGEPVPAAAVTYLRDQYLARTLPVRPLRPAG